MPNTGHNWRRETGTELDLTRPNSGTTRVRAVQFMPLLGTFSFRIFSDLAILTKTSTVLLFLLKAESPPQ